jgi:hypothetical protein
MTDDVLTALTGRYGIGPLAATQSGHSPKASHGGAGSGTHPLGLSKNGHLTPGLAFRSGQPSRPPWAYAGYIEIQWA